MRVDALSGGGQGGVIKDASFACWPSVRTAKPMDLDRHLCSYREDACAARVPAPLCLRNCRWYVTTIRFAAHRGSTGRDRARTARIGASPMVVYCQDALRTRFTENWCEMVMTGEYVKPLV